MEGASLAVGIVLMLVAGIGIIGYVALVVAIPVCRLLDWIAGEEPKEEDDWHSTTAVPTPWLVIPAPLVRAATAVATPLAALSTRMRRSTHCDDMSTVCPACQRPLDIVD
jgi:hypothetical protein